MKRRRVIRGEKETLVKLLDDEIIGDLVEQPFRWSMEDQKEDFTELSKLADDPDYIKPKFGSLYLEDTGETITINPDTIPAKIAFYFYEKYGPEKGSIIHTLFLYMTGAINRKLCRELIEMHKRIFAKGGSK